MKWLLILVVLAVVASPVLWMMPSQKEKRQQVMRERARRLNLDVKIGHLPQTHRSRVRQEDQIMGVAYRARIPRAHAAMGRLWQAVRPLGAENWQQVEYSDVPEQDREVLVELFEKLPPDTVAVAAEGDAFAIYWRERGDERAVEQVNEALRYLREKLA